MFGGHETAEMFGELVGGRGFRECAGKGVDGVSFGIKTDQLIAGQDADKLYNTVKE